MGSIALPAQSVRAGLVWLGLLVFVHVVAAQDVAAPRLDPDLWVTQYVYKDWQVEDGLPQNSVYAIEQTRDGYLWLGTQEGLVRFDGVRFQIYDTYRFNDLPSHSISALLEDRNGDLWMGTDEGGIVRYRNGHFDVYANASGMPGGEVYTLFEDRDGVLWVGSHSGLVRYDGRSFKTFTTADGLPGDHIVSIEQDRSGALWIGTDSGLSRYADHRFTNYYREDGLPGNTIRALFINDAGALWIGTNGGLTRLRGGAFQHFDLLDGMCDGTITDVIEDQAGTLWVATRENGVCRMSESGVQHFDRTTGISYNNVGIIYEDREGSIWLGTEGGGLNQIRGGKFAVFGMPEGLADDAVYSIYEDRSGAMWVGTSTGGLHRIDGHHIEQFTEQDGLSSAFVLTILEDKSGTLWVGTFDGGLCRLNGERFECLSTEDELHSDFVRTLHEDSRGVIWIGTDAGLHRFDGRSMRHYGTGEGLPHHAVMSIAEDQAGDLWIGTGDGVVRVREDEIVTYDGSHGQVREQILAIHEDARGYLWLGTFGSGLYRLRDGEVMRYTTDVGLFDDTAIQILEDDLGYLWIGSNKGIARLARSQFDALDAGLIEQLTPDVYDEKDGLRSREANGGTQPAAFKSRDGRLWFSTMRGAAVIDPNRIVTNPVPPPVVLESFVVNEEAVEPEVGLSLEPDGKKFAFRYTALSFVASEGVRFEYRLDGVDVDWVDAGGRREAFYTNLRPGRYRFRVRAMNGDGVLSANEATLTFHLQPRFYQTSWFLLLAALTLLGMVAGSYTLRTRHMRLRQLRLAELVESQTAELQLQKHELQRLNENLEQEVQGQLEVIMKERSRYEQELISAKQKAEESADLKATILTNMTHEIRTPLAAILGYGQVLSEETDGEQKEFADHITDNGRRLLDTLDSILELSALENGELDVPRYVVDVKSVVDEVIRTTRAMADAKGIDLHYEAEDGPVCIDGDDTALMQIIRKLVENAIKFTEKGGVDVTVTHTDEHALVQVRDTGIGIGEEFVPHLFEAFKQESQGLSRSHQGSGLGLAVASRLAASLEGHIHVETGKNEGSVFTLELPLRMEGVLV